MPFRHGKGTVFKLGTFGTPATVVDLSAYLTEVGNARSADTADVTPFLATNKQWLVGVADFGLALSGFFDAVIDAQLSALVGQDVAPNFEYGPEGSAAGRVKYSGTAFVTAYNTTNPVAGAVGLSATLVPASAIARGVWP